MKIGIDWGGTKIEAAVLSDDRKLTWRKRRATPAGDYPGAIQAVRDLVQEAEAEVGGGCTVGIGIPGTISPHTGLVMNANSVWLNGKPLQQDVTAALERPVRIANDANCFAVSEAVDGAGMGADVVFGVIIGTGVGGGIAINGSAVSGGSGICGEWGHTPLPWSPDDPTPDNPCWCGRKGCVETCLSGPGLARDYARRTNAGEVTAEEIIARMRAGEKTANLVVQTYTERLARSLAGIINILDPDIIVLGGGLSNITELYARLPDLAKPHVFTKHFTTPIRQARHGDSSGVRGAAWLWP